MLHPTKAGLSTSADDAQSMAVTGLTFLAADAQRLETFLSITGLGPHNLRQAADDPGFYGSVLEYLLADERLLLAFAADAGLEAGDVAKALEKLRGRSLLTDGD
jgi:hypothetical protein